jgi:hypothetical protein
MPKTMSWKPPGVSSFFKTKLVQFHVSIREGRSIIINLLLREMLMWESFERFVMHNGVVIVVQSDQGEVVKNYTCTSPTPSLQFSTSVEYNYMVFWCELHQPLLLFGLRRLLLVVWQTIIGKTWPITHNVTHIDSGVTCGRKFPVTRQSPGFDLLLLPARLDPISKSGNKVTLTCLQVQKHLCFVKFVCRSLRYMVNM